MSKGDQVRLGRERILRSLVKCGGDEDPVRHLTVQNKYFEDYDSQLGKTVGDRRQNKGKLENWNIQEMRKLFGKAKLQDVLQEYMAKDVEMWVDPPAGEGGSICLMILFNFAKFLSLNNMYFLCIWNMTKGFQFDWSGSDRRHVPEDEAAFRRYGWNKISFI